MVKTTGVVHFSIPVTDPGCSAAFYRDILGLSVLIETPEMVFLDSGGDCIVLVKVDPPISTAGMRNVHHAFQVEDAEYKKAVEELYSKGVLSYCLTLDPNADNYVKRIFGINNYTVIDNVERLPEKLPTLFASLTA